MIRVITAIGFAGLLAAQRAEFDRLKGWPVLPYQSISVIDDARACVGLTCTIDGGETWTRLVPSVKVPGGEFSNRNSPHDPVYSRFDSPSIGWLLGDQGLWRTIDAGKSWRRVLAVGPVGLPTFSPDRSSALVMASGNDGTRGFKSSDRGRHWTPCVRTLDSDAGFRTIPTALQLVSKITVWASFESTDSDRNATYAIAVSHDGGCAFENKWASEDTDVVIRHISFSGERRGWALIHNVFDREDHLVETSDGGISWTTHGVPLKKTETSGIFADEDAVWIDYGAALERGQAIWVSRDGAKTWEQISDSDIVQKRQGFPAEWLNWRWARFQLLAAKRHGGRELWKR